ncbi:hypothetical protein SYJ56_04520 [Algoriphagus sp. D3-2-R+10]|uniref:hypothetical protein n=1 Tax=Algoriphagus aurantiacus TaxID=3103948 RepID=UPI002B3B05E8|nr:hypothetical protein [Algoriphagus sp. D3-2-R+10]MEB2774556.1 hypothetical protein [Algoriphagus sp. D3-2-R+10]
MAKKLNDSSKGNKNLGIKQRGLGMLINTEPESNNTGLFEIILVKEHYYSFTSL